MATTQPPGNQPMIGEAHSPVIGEGFVASGLNSLLSLWLAFAMIPS